MVSKQLFISNDNILYALFLIVICFMNYI